MKVLYEDEDIRLCSTERDYDFIATIENKNDYPIFVCIDDDDGQHEGLWHGMDFYMDSKGKEFDWIGLLADDYTPWIVEQICNGNFVVDDGE